MMYKLLCEYDKYSNGANGTAHMRIEKQIQELLNKGWKLYGFMSVTNETIFETAYLVFSQAMIYDDTTTTNNTSSDDETISSTPDESSTANTSNPKIEKIPAMDIDFEEFHRKIREATEANLKQLQENLRSAQQSIQPIINSVRQTVKELNFSLNNQENDSKNTNNGNSNDNK